MSEVTGFFARFVPSSQKIEAGFLPWRSLTFRSLAAVSALLMGAAGVAAQAGFPSENVGTASSGQAVAVTATNAGTVSTIQVLTLGQASLDFTADNSLTTCTGASLTTGGSCNVGVIFTPSAAGERIGAVVLLDAGSNVLGTSYINGTGTGSLAAFVPGYVSTFAGNSFYKGAIGDGGPALDAELYIPSGIAFDGAGNLYIADNAHNRVRMVCAASQSGIISGTQAECTAAGIIITVAGGGAACAKALDTFGDGCLATDSTLSNPGGVTIDGAGNLYIADTGTNLVRVVNPATGIISVFAGNLLGASGECGTATDSLGDGCKPTAATLNEPQGVTLDLAGNVYIADTSNNRIRAVFTSTGQIITLAGGGTGCTAQTDAFGDGCPARKGVLSLPYTVAFDAAGNMYIPDSSDNLVREVLQIGGAVTSSNPIEIYAGTGTAGYTGDGRQPTNAELFAPSGVVVDPAQNIYIADTQNNAIRKVSKLTGRIETLISNTNNQDYDSAASPPAFLPLPFYGPIGLAFDTQGDLFIGDSLDMIVQEMQANLTFVNLLPPPATRVIRVGSTSGPQDVTIEDIGNAPLDLTAITPQADAQVSPTSTCAAGAPSLPAGDDCIVGAVFAPTTVADPLVTNIDVTYSPGPLSPPQMDIEIVGQSEALNATTTTVTATPEPSAFGQNVVFTVNVVTGIGTLSGTVTITDTFNGTQSTLASNLPLNSSGNAIYSNSKLPVGVHTIVAAYSGDPGHTASTSTDNGALPWTQTVNEATNTTLISSQNPSALGQSVTFTATVTSGGGGIPLQGTVTFMNGTTALSTQPLGASLTATYTTTTLPLGNNPITAVYSGDTPVYVSGSTSAVLTQQVQTGSTVTVTSTPNPSSYGTQVTFTATVSSAATTSVGATGTVTFLDNGTQIGTGTLSGNPATAQLQISTLAVATHPITVSYPGDASFGSATSQIYNQTVTTVPTTVAVSSTPVPGIAGVPVAITATISSSADASLLTGTVTFTIGTNSVGPVNVTNGVATTNQTLAAGTYQVVATYSGTSNLGGSTSNPYTLTVNSATTTTTLSITPNPAVADSTITFSATVTGSGVAPTGSVAFMSGSTTLGTANLTGGVAIFNSTTLAVGSYTVTAVYSGDANNGGSTSAAVNLTVGLIPTTTDLVATSTAGTPPQVLLVGVVTGTAGPTPTGPITFTSNGQTIGTATLDADGVGSFTPNLPNGTYQIVAAYGGDTIHSPSQSAAVSVSGAPAGFSLTVNPTTLSLAASQNGTVTTNIASVGGFTDTIALGCAALPAGVTCTFVSPSVSLAANGTATSQLTIDTNSPLSGGTSAMNSGRGRGMNLAGLFLPFSLFFGFAFWRMRKRSASLLTLVLVAALSLGALTATGCSGFGGSTVTPGTYSVVITGIGTQSNTVHYTTLTLTITK